MKALALSVLALSALSLSAAQDPEREGDRARVFEGLLRRFDRDGDERLTRGELPRGRRGVLARLDADGDGSLSRAEFDLGEPDSSAVTEQGDPSATSAADPAALEHFETRVRPVLSERCYGCHSSQAERIKGGLRVDSRELLLEGGASGPAIVPGDPEASLLVHALRYDDEALQMPPKQRLDAELVGDIERWIALGAPWPEEASAPATLDDAGTLDVEAGRSFWAFQPPRAVDPPAVRDEAWAWTEIDRFLLAKMESAGVEPVADADRRAWLRRLSFDLTGLPPTPEELAAFESDRSESAYEAVVDRLLASPRYGERWGRHWLDVARYAESSGKDSNVLYPHAWRYRDWVIEAFDRDLAFDRFVMEQLAGDLLPAADEHARAAQQIATGYLALGPKSHNERDPRQFAADLADEQIDAVTQGMLGLTVACARCHDHKYDPIPTEDYYALAGIFRSTDTLYGTLRGPGNRRPSELVALPEGAQLPDGPRMDPALRSVLERQRQRLERTYEGGEQRSSSDAPAGEGETDAEPSMDRQQLVRRRIARDGAAILDDLFARFDENGRALPANRLAMGVSEGRASDARVLARGELDAAGARVPRAFPQVLREEDDPRIDAGSGRLELAQWIASASNPLTARVWVNRVWLHLFGRGIVPTPDNFGASGRPPSHPELLDQLALRFVEDGWSTKALIRRIVLSHAYRLASAHDEANARVDPEVELLWRSPERRLDAEAIRDALLFAAGTLELERPVGSPVGALEGQPRRAELFALLERERPVRSVYLAVLRDRVAPELEVFDAADPSFVTGQRETTTAPTQALHMMNDEGVLRAADALAARVLAFDGSDARRIALAFELALAREPSTGELAAVQRFLREFPELVESERAESAPAERPRRARPRERRVQDAPRVDPRAEAWAAFALSLFQTAEFRYAS